MKFENDHKNMSANDIRREIIIPEEFSSELAEFLGILFGDGYMNFYEKKKDYIIEITGDSRLDKNYLESHVYELVENIFNIKPKYYFRKNQNTMNLRLRSKIIFLFLKEARFKQGFKDQISIPKWILENQNHMKKFIRGFADTDGSLMIKRDNYPKKNYVLKVSH